MSEGVEKEFHLHRITTLLQHPAEDEYVAQEGVATPAGVSRVMAGKLLQEKKAGRSFFALAEAIFSRQKSGGKKRGRIGEVVL